MGIAAVIGGVAAATGVANTVAGLTGGGASGAVGQLAGAGVSSAAQLQAGQIQADAAQSALDATKGTTATSLQTFNPFMANVPGSETGIANLLGYGPQGTAGELAALKATPGFQFALQQGLEGVTSSASGAGLARSGALDKNLVGYSQGLAGQTYQNMVQNFITSGNQGLNATNNFVSTAQSAQNTENSLMLAKGQATASGLVGAANTLGGAFMNAGNNLPGAAPTNSSEVPGVYPYQANPYQYNSLNPYQTNPYQITAPNGPETQTIDPNAANLSIPINLNSG